MGHGQVLATAIAQVEATSKELADTVDAIASHRLTHGQFGRLEALAKAGYSVIDDIIPLLSDLKANRFAAVEFLRLIRHPAALAPLLQMDADPFLLHTEVIDRAVHRILSPAPFPEAKREHGFVYLP